MDLWQIWILIGVLIAVIDLFTATMFLLNISIGFFLAAICAYFGIELYIQLIVLLVSSSLAFVFLRPLLLKIFKSKEFNEFDDKYINQKARVIKEVNRNDGRIVVFGEEWNAKSLNECEVFAEGEEVKISKKIDMTMYIEKL